MSITGLQFSTGSGGRAIASLLAATLLFAPAPAPAQGEGALPVLATVGMIGDLAARVGGDCATVETLLGPGIDPHYYVARPSDIARIAQARLILYVDAALEEQLARVLERGTGGARSVGLLRAAFAPEDLRDDPDSPGSIDPHLWMDVGLWSRILPVIAAEIAAERPACSAALEARAAEVGAQLAALDDWARAAFATIPEAQRILVTAHDAFGYLSSAYGFEVSEAIAGISTTAEASIADIREVAAVVVETGVPAVFVETTINPRTVEALVREVRALGGTVEIGGELFADAMGDAGTPEGSYIGMVRANVVTITTALGGELPDWPEALEAWAAEWGLAP